MDADFSHDPARLPALLEASREADLALGSRYVEGGGTVHWGLGRRILSRGGSLYARIILGLRVRDLTGGFKCFRREVLESIDLPSVRSSGYAFQIELTYRTVRKGFRVREVPIVFADRRVGKSKMSRRIVAEALWMVWKIRLWSALTVR
jgi:dolichol-phosphate mannosyltransferase